MLVLLAMLFLLFLLFRYQHFRLLVKLSGYASALD